MLAQTKILVGVGGVCDVRCNIHQEPSEWLEIQRTVICRTYPHKVQLDCIPITGDYEKITFLTSLDVSKVFRIFY